MNQHDHQNQIINVWNKVCVITGAGGALGGAAARALGREGARVVVLDIQEEPAEKTAQDIRNEGGEAKARVCNVLDKESLEDTMVWITKEFGSGPECLINAAGGNQPEGSTDLEYYSDTEEGKTFQDLTFDGMKKTFDLNYFGTVLPSQVFSRTMLEARKGSIVNFASVSSFNPLTKVVSYSAAKAGVASFTKWLAVHYSRYKVRVNAIAPGFILTEQLRFLHYNAQGEYSDRAKKVMLQTPMERYGQPEELTGAILWLLSDSASFVTGSVMQVDGGFSSYTI